MNWDPVLAVLVGASAGCTLVSLVRLIPGDPLRRFWGSYLLPWWRTEVQGRCPSCCGNLRRPGSRVCRVCLFYRQEVWW